MRTAILHSVRNKARRFPGKVLKPVAGANLTAFLIRRLKTARAADRVIVATSTHPDDAVLCRIAEEEGVGCFRGSLDDKLRRYRDAARREGLEFVVVVDGDDPLVSIEHIDRIIEYAAAHPADFVLFEDLPLGATGFGVRASALERVCESRPEGDTEVWGRMFFDDPAFACVRLKETNPLWRRPEIRMTIDYPEDYAFLTAVVDGLRARRLDPTFANTMALLADRPEIVEINRGVQAAYESHLKKSTSR